MAFSLPTRFGIRYILSPYLIFYRLIYGLVRRLAGASAVNASESESDPTDKDVFEAVGEGTAAGSVPKTDAGAVGPLMEFRYKEAGEIMTPRAQIMALPATANLAEVRNFIKHKGYSRIPVYGKNIDDIKGVLYTADLSTAQEPAFNLSKIIRKVPIVAGTTLIPDLLREMREGKFQLAIVAGELGGTAGLVTIEDIVEELVGEIADGP